MTPTRTLDWRVLLPLAACLVQPAFASAGCGGRCAGQLARIHVAQPCGGAGLLSRVLSKLSVGEGRVSDSSPAARASGPQATRGRPGGASHGQRQ